MRILLNVLLAFVLASGSVYLFSQDASFLGDWWRPETGMIFSGASRLLLASSMLLLAAFAVCIAWRWARGVEPVPTAGLRPHPSYNGGLMLRYRFLVVPALIFPGPAIALAEQAPNPSPQQMPRSGAAGLQRWA